MRRNPRVLVVEDLRKVIIATQWTLKPWRVTRKITENQTPGARTGNYVTRLRRPDEYPENSVQQWKDLSRAARRIGDAMYRIAMFADQQHAEIKNQENVK